MGTTAAPGRASVMAQDAQHPPSLPTRSRLTLERVLGVTSLSNAMLSVNPVTGEIAYAAGCIVVIYNLRRNKQVRYYRVEKSVACLCFSPNGQFLAIGEKGYLPAITIWDGADGTLCAELQMHKYGVACMAFSRDGRFLLSAGLVHDQHMYAWDLARDVATEQMKGKPVGVAKVEEKVLAMDYCHEGNFFVSVGEKHFKFWFLDADNSFLTTGYELNDLPEIQGRAAVLSAKEGATFTSVGCGFGACKLKTFAVTADGTLCSFGVSCVMERIVSLEASCGNALSVTESYVAVGGSSSVIRLFGPSTLEYKATLPFPPAFGKANVPPEELTRPQPLHPHQPHRYPATIGVRLTGSHLVALYSDKSIFIYDISDPQEPRADRSFLFHSGCVRDLKIAGKLKGVNGKGKLIYHGLDSLHARKTKSDGLIPQGTFITCGDDNTLRFWHLDARKSVKSSRFTTDNANNDSSDNPEAEPWKNPFSQEMLDIVYHDDPAAFEEEDATVLGGTCSWNDLADIHMTAKDIGPVNCLRAVAIHPSLNAVAMGDKDGTLVLRQLPLAENSGAEIGGYTGEIQCVAFGELQTPLGGRFLVAAGSRDRLVHVHDSSKDYSNVAKLDNHSGAVTSVNFTHDGKRLISCGADKNVVFSDVQSDGKISRYNSIPLTGGKIFDMALAADDEHLIASTNNRLDILSISSGKVVRSLHVGEQHRIDLCPASYCVAMSGSLADKTIHIVDLATGETLADGTGHGEVITGIKFTPDCRRVVSSSNDGCIFVWRLAEDLQNAIKSRLPRITEPVLAPPAPPSRQEVPKHNDPSPSMLMPPPAPPIVQAKRPHTKATPPSPSSGVTPTDEKKADPKKLSNEENRGWKGKAKAAPGPLGNVPMEDWMKTRESAKRTVQVSNASENIASDACGELGTSDAKATMAAGALKVDRSKTPDWARTFQVSRVGDSSKTSPPKPTTQAPSVGSKWSQRVPEILTVAIPSEDQTANRGSPPKSEPDEPLLQLSIANIDVSQSVLLGGSSLALEREQHEKRKKQIETAKAVAEMNERLSKLGLLRRSPANSAMTPNTKGARGHTSTHNPDWKSVDDTELPNAEDNMSPQRMHTENHKKSRSVDMSGIPPEMFESIDTTTSKPPTRRESISTPGSRRTSLTTSIDLRVDQSLSTYTSGFAADASAPHDDIAAGDDIVAVDQSLSAFSSGYRSQKSVSVGCPERRGFPDSVDSSQTILNRAEVGASLSAFTEGFKAETAPDPRQSIDLSSVSASMSSFTDGYSEGKPTASPVVKQSLDLRSVTASLSQFTEGYETDEKPADIPVEKSLSSFTSGFTSAPLPKVSPVRTSTQGVRVEESLSVFTTGYAEADAQEVSEPVTADVAVSLSTFTSGYVEKPQEASQTQTTPTTPAEKKAYVLSSISDLDQQLMATTQALKAVNGDSNSAPEIDEIRELMGKLRDAVQRFASKR